jgi:cell division initiation protein
MAITPQDIEQQAFSAAKQGYNTEEVDDFLEIIANEVDAMLNKIADLKNRLTNTENELAAAQAQLAAAPARTETVVAPVADFSASERQISQALIIAQQAAEKVVADARDNADRIRNEADQKAREVIRQALAEKQNELDEIDRLKQSREDFRSEYKKLLQHFMDDADAVFPEQTLSTPSGSSYSAPAPQPAPNATVYAPASQPTQAKPALDDFDDFGDLD